MLETQKPGFEELYQAFFDFFIEAIRRDPSPWGKIKLQMQTQYFDDLALYKATNPIVLRIVSNPEERRAIARAALWDVMLAHHMGQIVELTTHHFEQNPYLKKDEKPPDMPPFAIEEAAPERAAPEAAPQEITIIRRRGPRKAVSA